MGIEEKKVGVPPGRSADGLVAGGTGVDVDRGSVGWVLSFCVAKHEVVRDLTRGILRNHDLEYADFEFLDAVKESPPEREQMALLGRRLELSDSSLRRRAARVRDSEWLVSDDSGGLCFNRRAEKAWEQLMASLGGWAEERLRKVPTTDRLGHVAAARVVGARLGLVRDPGSIAGFMEAAREAVRRWAPTSTSESGFSPLTNVLDQPSYHRRIDVGLESGRSPMSSPLTNILELLRLERPLFTRIRQAVEQAGMDIERADLLLVLDRLGVSGEQLPSPGGPEGWVSLQRFRRGLVQSPWIAQAQFSRWLSQLEEQGLVDRARTSELGSATSGRCKFARITEAGRDRIRPVWDALVHLSRRLASDIPDDWLASAWRTHVALAPDRLSPGSGASLVTALTSGMPQLTQPAGTTSGESPRRDLEVPSAFEAPRRPDTGFTRGPAERGRLFADPTPARDSVGMSAEDNPAEVFLSGLRSMGGWATHEELRTHLGWTPRKYNELLALLHHRSRVDGAPDSPTVRLTEMKLDAPWSALLRNRAPRGQVFSDGRGQ
jgi:hypothetical protein